MSRVALLMGSVKFEPRGRRNEDPPREHGSPVSVTFPQYLRSARCMPDDSEASKNLHDFSYKSSAPFSYESTNIGSRVWQSL